MNDRDTFRAPRGTQDLLPPESWRWQHLTRLALDTFALAGYAPIETPIFEHTEVFTRGVGAASDVVTKQMYTFTDKGGRSLTLRPEGTAPVVRAVLEHGLDRGSLPVKVAYAAPMFRQERPQKGRYRQFLQLGVEAIGSDLPVVDAEVIEVAASFYRRAGLEPSLLLNSIGHLDPGCRQGYLKLLTEFLVEHRDDLAPEDRERVNVNPLRTFDSKEEGTIATMREAPLISDHLCASCREHFGLVRTHLDVLGVDYVLEPRLVRGLDYYTRTTFEFVAEGLGAQNSVGGGGRYDGLSQSLGGPRLPSIGFALGLDRIILASGSAGAPLGVVAVYVVSVGAGAQLEALRLASLLRSQGVGAETDLAGRSMKGQMKDAARSGARYAAIIGEAELRAGEVTLKDLRSSEQERVPVQDLAQRVAS